MDTEETRKLAEELLFSEKKRPSFAKELYFGRFLKNSVFPFPEAGNETDFLAQVEAFAEREIDGAAIDRHAEIPRSVIEGLGKLGLLGMTVPREYGGLGMSQHTYCRALELIAKRCGATALFINAHQSIGLKALLLFGTKDQKQKWLPPLARGEMLAAFSLTEPNAGSDAGGIETTAVHVPEKHIYRINGRKQWTTNGSIASILTVMAKLNGKVTAFLVTPDMPGFHIRDAKLEKVGMRGSVTSNLDFIDLEVPEANVLGPIGGGLKVCLTVLDYGRTTFGASCTGAAKFLLGRAYEHAESRKQFNRPLASFGLVKEKLARMAALTYAMDATTYLTAGLIDSGVEDFMLETAILKVFASESLWEILYDTMQIYGGRSFFTDQPFERMMRDARLNMIGEGSNEVMRVFIGAVGMRDVGKELQQVSKLWRLILRLRLPEVPFGESKRLAKTIRRFGIAVVRLLARHREGIVEKQLILNRMATAAIAIYTTTAALSKGGDLANLYANLALDKADLALSQLSNPRDAEMEAFI